MGRKSRRFCEIEHLELRRLLSTIYVDAVAPGPTHDGSSWAEAYNDLQQALSAATSGMTIEVGQGTYYPTGGTDRTATLQLIDGVEIDGGYAGYGTANPDSHDFALYPTVLSGDIGAVGDNSDNSYHVVTGSYTDSAAVLDGFTITGGNANANNDISPNANGGGIYDHFGSPTISDCTITGNTAVYSGGGISNSYSSPTMTDCTISDNTAPFGGGMGNSHLSSPILTNCSLDGNTAEDGGGMFNGGGFPTLNNCTINGNTAEDGGGIDNADFAATLNYCTLSGNTAYNNGGGMLNVYSFPTLTNCIISGNTARNGGGIDNVNYAGPTLTDCTLSGNVATDSGGGMENNYNYAYYGYTKSPTLTNCILWGDNAPTGNEVVGGTDGVTITYSDIDQSGFAGTGDIDADPQFIRSPNPGPDGTWGTAGDDYGDLHLQFTSPCIDAGSNAAVPAGVTTDLDGNPRIFDFPGANDPGAIVDMGAYELGYNLDAVIVPAGQTLTLPKGGYTFTANQFVFQGVGELDIADDTLAIQYTSGNDPIGSIALAVGSGSDGGLWRGAGIISSAIAGDTPGTTGIGYFDDGTQVKISRTWYGDANLDGQINADDLSLMMAGQAEDDARWQDGNFNYDAQVNADDWMQFLYGLAYSNGQMLPATVSSDVIRASNKTAVTMDALVKTAMPTFAQTPIGVDQYLSELLDSPQAVI